MLQFDWTITIGNLLTIAGVLGGAFIFMSAIRTEQKLFSQRLVVIEKELNGVDRGMARLAEVVTQVAVQKTRLDTLSERMVLLDKRYEELRHGEGFVHPLKYPKDI